MKYNEKLIKCVRCPTAYHGGDSCVAAGTVQITKTDMICPKHYEPPPKGKNSYYQGTVPSQQRNVGGGGGSGQRGALWTGTKFMLYLHSI
jgi:hypothetical protein